MHSEEMLQIQPEETETKFIPHASEISIETLVNMLVRKGVFTADELFMLEGKIREETKSQDQTSYMKIKNHHDRGRLPRLKKTMSRRRWSRRLGAFLFGWKWKKVKNSHSF